MKKVSKVKIETEDGCYVCWENLGAELFWDRLYELSGYFDKNDQIQIDNFHKWVVNKP